MKFPFKVEIITPKLTRGQVVCTGVLCTVGTVLWTVPSWQAGWADVSGLTLTAGVTIPAGVAWVGWIVASATGRHDVRALAEQRAAEKAQADALELARLRTQVRNHAEARVVEGEVVR